ncbi:hypothetical protein Q3G72_031415 [Acer saccharum]|nr:hypothetical protein Q3G72_031415 [Acer saccharum]
MGSSSPPLQVLVMISAFLYWVWIFGFVHVAQAQNNNQSQATTDPDEANQDQWNISGEPCSGAAIDSTSFDNNVYNPFIKCVCSYNNNTLCHITQLKVYALDVVGMIPDELWTLTFLFDLNLGQNYLTGPLSASIRNLTAMQFLSFGINALSGELPKELGMLTELLSLSVASNNFSGSLPSELGNLMKLQQLYISSSGVTGEIPSSFANLRNLLTVWASDVELIGRIPDFIGNWSKLDSLRFQGNSFEGPIPSSFSNLTTLTELELRNNNISDSIPSNIGEYQRLQHLDLSFNNIGGDIPDSLFNLSLLSHLFLGNNKLNGTLPTQKSTSLLNIALPFGLNCLQRNFPCNRGAGIYYNFSIKCGGPQITSSNGIVYERDNTTLGPSSYFVDNTSRWGVSNVGYFTGSNNPQYTSFSQSQFTNTLDSELFQTARISASSLRYYGLGLENGNYNVTLQFAEIDILDTTSWKSIGRRKFDIYIQFPRNIILSISLLNSDTDFIPTVSNKPSTIRSKTNRTGLIVGIVVGVGLVSFLLAAILWIIRRRKRPSKDDDDEEKTDVFAFGVVALEVVSGRPNSDSSLEEEQAWNLHENNRQVELVDSRLPEFNEEEVKRMIGVALLCTQTLPSLRPPMSRVVAMLCGDIEVSTVTTKPGYLTDWKYDDTTATGSFMSSTDKATIGTDTSNYTSSTTTSMVVVAETQRSAETDTEPILYGNL